MKKLALALVASSFVAGAATADITTGYYLGAGLGMNTFTAKASGIDGNGDAYNSNLGRNRPQLSLYTGYGFVSGCTYLGAELGYTFTGGKVSSTTNASTTTYERRSVINAAFLVGQKFTPSTMMYLRLGMNSAQYKGSQDGDASFKHKRKLSFAPGLGMETAITKNVRARLEYTYDLGNKFSTFTNDKVKISSQSVTLGVAYKF